MGALGSRRVDPGRPEGRYLFWLTRKRAALRLRLGILLARVALGLLYRKGYGVPHTTGAARM